LPKFFNLGQGAIGETIEAAGARQFGRLHKEALNCTTALGTTYVQRIQSEQTWCSRGQKSKNDPAPLTDWSVNTPPSSPGTGVLGTLERNADSRDYAQSNFSASEHR
jgi:hypothetical protein